MMPDIYDMQTSDYADVADATGFDAGKLDAERVDQHFAAVDRDYRVRARCSIWWRDTANLDGASTGAIGHFAAADPEYGNAVLEQAASALKQRGCGVAIGPLDGNTWRSYRFVTERGTAPPFFLEPDNPDDWPRQFAEAGFAPLAHYVSEMNDDIGHRQPALGDLRRRFDALGVTIEPLDIENPVDDMLGIYQVARESFSSAFLYTPLDVECFGNLYDPLLHQVDPRLMLVAKHDGDVVGFILGPPDYLQRSYQSTLDAIVIKTVAVMPQEAYRGLGRVLIVDLLQNAIDMGFTAAISALMHTGNRSQQISADCAGPMRGYTLFARAL